MDLLPHPMRFDLAGEISFWRLQGEEHCLFLELGLVHPDLRALARRLRHDWAALKGETTVTPELLGATRAFAQLCENLLVRLRSGEWLGWLHGSFIEHIAKEIEFFALRITGKLPRGLDACGWVGFMCDHAAFAGGLLDPSEEALVDQAESLRTKFTLIGGGAIGMSLGCSWVAPTFVQLSLDAGAELDAYFRESGIGTPKVKSIIHPVLSAHVVREGQRFLGTVARMKGTG